MVRQREQVVQLALCQHTRREYPDAIFTCDFAAGLKLPPWLAKLRAAMSSGRGYPDYTLDVKRGDFAGLRLELKAEGEVVYKRDGTVRASKNDRLQIQHDTLEQLRKEGYCAEFAIGLDQATGILDWYMAGAEPGTLLLERSSEGAQRFTNTKSGEVF